MRLFRPLCFGAPVGLRSEGSASFSRGAHPPHREKSIIGCSPENGPQPLAGSRPAKSAGSWAHARPHPSPITGPPPRMLANLFRRYPRRNNHRARLMVGGLCDPSFTAAFLARRGIDFAPGSHRLHYHGIAGAIACRTFLLGRFSGGLSHLSLLSRVAASFRSGPWHRHGAARP
jgi:hypothetical protein